MKQLILVLILLSIVVLASSVEAHHKQGHSGGPPTSLTASFVVTPSSPTAFTSMFIEGFDFEPGEVVRIMIQENWCCIWGEMIPDQNGQFSFRTRTRDPGTYKICGLVDFDKGAKKVTACGGKSQGTLVAFLEFQVVP